MFLVVRLRVRRSCMGFFSCRKRCGILRLRGCGIGSEQQGREIDAGFYFYIFVHCVVLSKKGDRAFSSTRMRGRGTLLNTHLDILTLVTCFLSFCQK